MGNFDMVKPMVWKPHVTVAAIVEREGQFLLVEEEVDNQLVFNQPAGHLEPNETLIQAVVRETLEETAWFFQPQALVGVYRWEHPEKELTYLRFAFCGDVSQHDPEQALDEGIRRALWMSPEDIRNCRRQHRSPQVERCMEDYIKGQRSPLELLNEVS